MHEYTETITGALLSMEQDLKLEFETRLTECSTLAYRVAFSVLRNSESSEDVAQEAFARAYSNFARLRDRNSFRAWLVRMTWRLAIDQLRADRRRSAREAVSTLTEAVQTPAHDVIARERAARLWQAIDALPEKLRIVVVLAGIEEHDTREVAVLLEVPEGTVKSRLFHARRRLKEMLQ